MATQRSKKGSEKVLGRFWEGFWGRVLRRVLKRGPALGFTVKKCSEKGSQKGFAEKAVSRRVPRTRPGEYDPLGVHPKQSSDRSPQSPTMKTEKFRTLRLGNTQGKK